MATYSITPRYNTTSYYDGTGETVLTGYDVAGLGSYNTLDAASQAIETALSDKYRVESGIKPTTAELLVDPYGESQTTMSNLIQARYDFLKNKSAPLESALFDYSAFDNPNLYNEYVSSAIPEIQKAYKSEQDVTSRSMAATGVDMNTQEQVLQDKLTSLQSQESITQAANQIRDRLRDRELQITFGSSSGNTATLAGTSGS